MEGNSNQYFYYNATAQDPALLPATTPYQHKLEIMNDDRRGTDWLKVSTDGQLQHFEVIEKYLHEQFLAQLRRIESTVQLGVFQDVSRNEERLFSASSGSAPKSHKCP